MKLSELYAETAELLTLHGVAAGQMQDKAGRMCALGAMCQAKDGEPWGFSSPSTPPCLIAACDGLVTALGIKHEQDRYNYRSTIHDATDTVAAWSNNLVDAGKPEDVIAGFKQAAEYWAKKETA